jgi:hypothetical protein
VKTFEVPAGSHLELSLANAAKLDVPLRNLRPRHVLALKRAGGFPQRPFARLGDGKAFEVVNNDAKDLIHLSPDKEGKIGGSPALHIRGIIRDLPISDKIPERVRVTQRVRGWIGPGGIPDIPGTRIDKQKLRELGWIAKTHDFLNPDWLRNLRVFMTTLAFDDLVVGANATLTIASGVFALTANNIRIHQGGRIIQKSPYLTVDVAGDIKGDLP